MSRKQKKYHYIYKTIDTRNGNFYIGMHSTDDLNDGYVGSGTRLKKLIYKYGKDIFSMEILEFLPDRESLKKREAEIVNSDLLLEDKCMNLKVGGEGGFINDEHMIKCSKAGGEASKKSGKSAERLRWLWENDEQWALLNKQRKSKSLKGRKATFKNRHHTEETKKLMSLKASSHTGEQNSQFNTCWITKDGVNKKIKNEDFIQYSNDGWIKGRS